ncbi:MAG TPA: DUF1959 family protein [Methanoregulaceae archaeon]|nr:DUF1959 family protein [Methanoregulaceae archaeon]
MTVYLYEKDLTAMKYAILVSTRHDRVIREIAHDLGISNQQMRRYIITRFDMILMENLPARYEAGKSGAESDALLANSLGKALYSRYIPLIDPERMNEIFEEVLAMIAGGLEENEAVARGKKLIAEDLLA